MKYSRGKVGKKNDQLHFFHYESFDVLYNTAHFSIYEEILLS